jgi:hypothetical protein
VVVEVVLAPALLEPLEFPPKLCVRGGWVLRDQHNQQDIVGEVVFLEEVGVLEERSRQLLLDCLVDMEFPQLFQLLLWGGYIPDVIPDAPGVPRLESTECAVEVLEMVLGTFLVLGKAGEVLHEDQVVGFLHLVAVDGE